MITSIEISQQLRNMINRALQLCQQKLQDFTSIILQKATPNQIQNILQLIDRGLTHFAEHIAKQQLQIIIMKSIEANSLQEPLQAYSELFDQNNLHAFTYQFTSDSGYEFLQCKKKIKPEYIQLNPKEEMKLIYACVSQIIVEEINLFKGLHEKRSSYQLDELFKFNNHLVLELLQLFIQAQLQTGSIQSKYKQSLVIQEIDKLTDLFKRHFRNITQISLASNQQEVIRLKHSYFSQIIKLKQNYSEIKIKLFKEELQRLWFFQLQEEQIESKIKDYSLNQLNKLQHQLTKWKAELQARSYLIDQTCFKHKSKIFYLCLTQTIKKNIYLCNKCISEEQELFQHCGHDIICKKHREQIKYKDISIQLLTNQQNSKQKQRFLCKHCIQINIPTPKYVFVSSCHYQTINKVCIQMNCIEGGDFMVCPYCFLMAKDKHQTHRVLKFDQKQLMLEFGLQKNVDVSLYQQELMKAQNMLKLDPLQKIRISYAKKTYSLMRCLQSFGVYSNQELQKRIERLLNEARKEDLMVLRWVLEIKEEQYSQIDILNYLEAFNWALSAEFQKMYELIWEKVELCCKRIKEFGIKNQQEVEEQLNKKYAQIMDIQTENEVVLFPKRLNQVHPVHFNRIQKIQVIRQREHEAEQKNIKTLRKKRATFFKQSLKKSILQNQIGQRQRKQLTELFINAEFWESSSQIPINLNELGKHQKHRALIQSLVQQLKKIHHHQENYALQWKQIASRKFTNLKVINIEYLRYKSIYQFERQLSINAFQLFKFICGNFQIEQLTIKGIFIQFMDQFIQAFNPTNCHPDILSYRENSKWIKPFQPRKFLHLTINFAYTINSNTPVPSIQDWLYFRRVFQWLSDTTVEFELIFDKKNGDSWKSNIQRLLESLREIKNLKVQIRCSNFYFIKYLLVQLSSFTNITLITFLGSYLNETSILEFQAFEESFSTLAHNNSLLHLGLCNCSHFPIFFNIATLQSIYLIDTSFKHFFSLDQFFSANKSLKSIVYDSNKCQWKIEDKLINHLEYLSIVHWEGVTFGELSSSPSRLKYLSIDGQNIDINILKRIFSKLVKISELFLNIPDFNYGLLFIIPSLQLQALSISNNNQIGDDDLQLIDSKWPYLRSIKLDKCPKVTERFLSLCKFRSLMEIRINCNFFSQRNSAKKYLKYRGIKFYEI